jgi:hypothetical protein
MASARQAAGAYALRELLVRSKSTEVGLVGIERAR